MKTQSKKEVKIKRIWHSNQECYPVTILVDGEVKEKSWLVENNIIISTRTNWYKVNSPGCRNGFSSIMTPEDIKRQNKKSGIKPSEWAGLEYTGICETFYV